MTSFALVDVQASDQGIHQSEQCCSRRLILWILTMDKYHGIFPS